VHHPHQVAGVAAGEVDDVRLADRLERGTVEPLLGRPDVHRLHLGTQGGEVLDAHLGPRPERRLAIGGGGRRQDHDPRPGAPGRRHEATVELGHRGEELTGADERHGSGHRHEHRACAGNPGGRRQEALDAFARA